VTILAAPKIATYKLHLHKAFV